MCREGGVQHTVPPGVDHGYFLFSSHSRSDVRLQTFCLVSLSPLYWRASMALAASTRGDRKAATPRCMQASPRAQALVEASPLES